MSAPLGQFITGMQKGYGAKSQAFDPLSPGKNASPGNYVPGSPAEDSIATSQNQDAPAQPGNPSSDAFEYDGAKKPGLNLMDYLGHQFGAAMAPNRGETAPTLSPVPETAGAGKIQPASPGKAGLLGAAASLM